MNTLIYQNGQIYNLNQYRQIKRHFYIRRDVCKYTIIGVFNDDGYEKHDVIAVFDAEHDADLAFERLIAYLNVVTKIE